MDRLLLVSEIWSKVGQNIPVQNTSSTGEVLFQLLLLFFLLIFKAKPLSTEKPLERRRSFFLLPLSENTLSESMLAFMPVSDLFLK